MAAGFQVPRRKTNSGGSAWRSLARHESMPCAVSLLSPGALRLAREFKRLITIAARSEHSPLADSLTVRGQEACQSIRCFGVDSVRALHVWNGGSWRLPRG